MRWSSGRSAWGGSVRGWNATVVQGFRYPGEVSARGVRCTTVSPSRSGRSRNSCSSGASRSRTSETVRQWCARFRPGLRQPAAAPASAAGRQVVHGRVFLKINGRLQYLWRAVDQDGNVLDILVQSKRNTQAAKRFFRRLLKEYEYVPRVIVTDKLRSYGAAHREVMPSAEHRSSKYLNKRAENSHQPTRRRERAIRRFTSPGHAQRSPSAFSGIPPRFRPRHHLLTTRDYRTETTHRFTTWRQATNCAATA
ncbi:IS6 family transposase [Streptomyces sp. NPDC003016]